MPEEVQVETLDDFARRFYVVRNGEAAPPCGPDDVCKVVVYKKRRRSRRLLALPPQANVVAQQ